MRLEESQVPRKEQGTGKVRRRVSSNWLPLFSKKAVVFMRRCCQFFRFAVEFRLEAHLQFEHLNLRLPVRSLSSQMDLLCQPPLKLIQNKVSLYWNIISPNHCWKYRWVFWGDPQTSCTVKDHIFWHWEILLSVETHSPVLLWRAAISAIVEIHRYRDLLYYCERTFHWTFLLAANKHTVIS